MMSATFFCYKKKSCVLFATAFIVISQILFVGLFSSYQMEPDCYLSITPRESEVRFANEEKGSMDEEMFVNTSPSQFAFTFKYAAHLWEDAPRKVGYSKGQRFRTKQDRGPPQWPLHLA